MVNWIKSFNGSDVELFEYSICCDCLKQIRQLLKSNKKLTNLQQLAKECGDELKGNNVVRAEFTNMYQLIETTYNSECNNILRVKSPCLHLTSHMNFQIYSVDNSLGEFDLVSVES